MKDTRFIELVNLYIDRQATPAEAAELELEIQSDPRRRQVYQQYCRMHRATKLVYESFRTHAEQSNQPARQPATIAHIQSRSRARRMRWAYAASGLAAAACIAFVLMRSSPTESTSLVASVETKAPATVVAALPQANNATPVQVSPTVESITPLNRPVLSRDYATLMAAFTEEDQRLHNLPASSVNPQLDSLFDDGVFDTRAPVLPLRANGQQNRRNPRAQTEFTAFQFQR